MNIIRHHMFVLILRPVASKSKLLSNQNFLKGVRESDYVTDLVKVHDQRNIEWPVLISDNQSRCTKLKYERNGYIFQATRAAFAQTSWTE